MTPAGDRLGGNIRPTRFQPQPPPPGVPLQGQHPLGHARIPPPPPGVTAPRIGVVAGPPPSQPSSWHPQGYLRPTARPPTGIAPHYKQMPSRPPPQRQQQQQTPGPSRIPFQHAPRQPPTVPRPGPQLDPMSTIPMPIPMLSPQPPLPVAQPPPPEYLYPPATKSIVDNISRSLLSLPEFYNQVLHLMNRMDLPPPFTVKNFSVAATFSVPLSSAETASASVFVPHKATVPAAVSSAPFTAVAARQGFATATMKPMPIPIRERTTFATVEQTQLVSPTSITTAKRKRESLHKNKEKDALLGSDESEIESEVSDQEDEERRQLERQQQYRRGSATATTTTSHQEMPVAHPSKAVTHPLDSPLTLSTTDSVDSTMPATNTPVESKTPAATLPETSASTLLPLTHSPPPLPPPISTSMTLHPPGAQSSSLPPPPPSSSPPPPSPSPSFEPQGFNNQKRKPSEQPPQPQLPLQPLSKSAKNRKRRLKSLANKRLKSDPSSTDSSSQYPTGTDPQQDPPPQEKAHAQ